MLPRCMTVLEKASSEPQNYILGGVDEPATYAENLISCILAGLNFKPCRDSQHLNICLRADTEGTRIAKSSSYA